MTFPRPFLDAAVARHVREGDATGLEDSLGEAVRLRLEEAGGDASAAAEAVARVVLAALYEALAELQQGRLILPALLRSAEVAQRARAFLQAWAAGLQPRGRVVVATVDGDVHDIGASLLKAVLKSAGYAVLDLGKQVPVQRIVEVAQEPGVDAVALSALPALATSTSTPTATPPVATGTPVPGASSTPTATRTPAANASSTPTALTSQATATLTSTAAPTPTATATTTATVTATTTATTTAAVYPTPNDPLYPQQWALPAMNWPLAWNTLPVTGSARLAVLDTGIDASQPDLAGRIVAGTSFTGGSPDTDPNGHGTALAGLAAADVNNGLGIAGVAYDPGVTVSPVQVLSASGTGWDSDVAAGVVWAADDGAQVVLLALDSPTYSPVLASAVAYAQSKGVVVVAATGNDGGREPTYPAGLPGVLGVVATNQQGQVASFSNTGDVAVAAPGVGVETLAAGGGYRSISGTSAGAAEVAGEAALLVGQGRGAGEVDNQVRAGVDGLSGRSYGQVDLVKALGVGLSPVATATAFATPTATGTAEYAAASTYTVNVNTDSNPSGGGVGTGTTGDLRYALTQANSNAGSTIGFDLASSGVQTITLGAALPPITASMTIDGSTEPGYSGSPEVVVDGASSYEPFSIGSGVTVALNALTIQQGSATNGGGIYDAGTLTVTSGTLSNNSASNDGAAIYNLGTLTVSGSTLSGNSATGDDAGGIYNNGGTVSVTGSTFSGNSAANAGGAIDNASGTLTVTNSTLNSNTADVGAAIEEQNGSVTVSASTLNGNSASSDGGGIFDSNAGTLSLSGSTLSNNSAGLIGGGIYFLSPCPRISSRQAAAAGRGRSV